MIHHHHHHHRLSSSFIVTICLIFVVLLSLVPSSVANIRSTRIRSSRWPVVLIDQFEFEFDNSKDAVGRVQLNVSHISLLFNPNPNPNLNLSEIGFVLTPSLGFIDTNLIDRIDLNMMFCSQPDEFQNLYTLDKLMINLDHDHFVNLEFLPNHQLSGRDVSLFFKNCLSSQVQVSMHIQSAMYNLQENGSHKNYLSAGKNRLLGFDLAFMVIYFMLTVAWIVILCKRRRRRMSLHPNTTTTTTTTTVFGIHYVMLLVLVSKLWNFPLEILNFYHIMHIGYPLAYSVLLRYLFDGIPLFLLLVLLGAEDCLFVKRVLLDRQKHFLTIIIPIQLLANMVKVYQTITFPCGDSCPILLLAYFLFEMVSLVALIFPIAFTAKRLLQVGQVDGKATLCLMKVKFFKHLRFAVSLYALAQVIVYVFKFIPLFDTWKVVLVGELEILALYMFLGYRLCPEVHDPISLINDEEEIAAAESLKVFSLPIFP